MRILIVLATLVCATAHSDSTTLPSVNIDAFKDWHRELDANAMILPEFSVEAKTAGEALKQTMEAYGISINVYLNPTTRFDQSFQYRGSNVSLATVLEAINEQYRLKLERDEDTGMSWLLPETLMLKDILSYHVTVEEARPGWPMYSGLLVSLERRFTKAALKGEEPALGVNLPARGIVGSRETTFDIPTHLQAGTYQAIDILHYCNQLAPWLSFQVWEDGHERFPHITIAPSMVSGDNCTKPTPGWTALWKIATKGAAPDFTKVLQTMLQSEEYNVFAAHLVRKLCRDTQPFLNALNSAATPQEKPTSSMAMRASAKTSQATPCPLVCGMLGKGCLP